ncbi:oxidoreductase [Devosia pacifica]|uniref:Oxidoreductase n=1 Tax=Devosia pacifica TaxID=1335967 RepID=A0A918RXX0_9HYPH|nr:NADH:flavin oxidoreductase/NADH oxidase [Devosia pacifica]GHA15625.1 oxidoreductase [Devosia pacifica]
MSQANTPPLFQPFEARGLTLRNRTVVAPMCQYSAVNGLANDWHFVHLGRFALGGFGLVIVEATAVTADGRISYGDLGLWNDEQIAPLKRINDFIHAQGSTAGLQLAHAGRKASTPIAWRHGFDETEAEKAAVGFESWTPVAPSPVIHAEGSDFTTPVELDEAGLDAIVEAFASATRRALDAGFDLVEVHAAHGYLLNQFLSPLANQRTDSYGGSRENRMRFPLRVVEAVREHWPEDRPLALRISVSDNHPDGWSVEDSIAFVNELKARGVDIIDCSSGGFSGGRIKAEPLYQVPFSEAIRQATGVPTMAVGLIHDPIAANRMIAEGQADFAALARGALDDPNWPVHAAKALQEEPDYDLWPIQAAARMRDRDRSLAAGATR